MKQMKKKIIDLEWAGDPPDIYCPVCGLPIYEKMDSNTSKCKHIIFSHLDIIGNFDYIKNGWEKKAEKAIDKAEELDNEPYEILSSEIDSKGFFCLQISTYSVGQGIIGSTVTIGIDFLASK